MVILDMDLNKISSGSFDTHESAEAISALRDFVKAIPDRSYFIGVSARSLLHLKLGRDHLGPAKVPIFIHVVSKVNIKTIINIYTEIWKSL